MRWVRIVTVVACAGLGVTSLSACSSSAKQPSPSSAAAGAGSSGTPTSTGQSTAGPAQQFDVAASKFFPGTSLAERRRRATEVCQGIKANGDNLVTFLTRSQKEQVVPFTAPSVAFGEFTGLAVKYVCPDKKYLDQLAQGLAGIPAGVNIGRATP